MKKHGDSVAQTMENLLSDNKYMSIFKTAQRIHKTAYDDNEMMEVEDKHEHDKNCVMDGCDHMDVNDPSAPTPAPPASPPAPVQPVTPVTPVAPPKPGQPPMSPPAANPLGQPQPAKAAALKAAVDVLVSMSEYFDNLGFEKTAASTLVLASGIIAEAKAKASSKKSKDSKDSKDSKKSKDSKDSKKSDKDSKKKKMSPAERAKALKKLKDSKKSKK